MNFETARRESFWDLLPLLLFVTLIYALFLAEFLAPGLGSNPPLQLVRIAMIFFVAGYCAVQKQLTPVPRVLMLQASFLGLLFFSMVLNTSSAYESALQFLIYLSHSSCLFFAYYYFKKHPDRANLLIWLMVAPFPFYVFQTYSQMVLSDLANVRGGMTVAYYTYHVAMVVPWVMLIRGNGWLKVGIVLATTVLVVAGAKRGAIIGLAAVLTVHFLFLEGTKASFRGMGRRFLIICILVPTSFFFCFQYWEQATGRFTRITSEGDVRIELYTSYWRVLTSTDSWRDFLWGHGGTLFVDLFSLTSHSDWWEMLLGWGAFVFVLFASFWCAIAFELRRTYKCNSLLFPSYLALFLFFLVKSHVSMNLTYVDYTYFTTFVGFALAVSASQSSQFTPYRHD